MPRATAAVVWETSGPFVLEDVDVDDPRDHEILVEIAACGMCHTDLSVRHGRTPFPLPGVLGHEGAGVVVAVGDAVKRACVGDHVVISFSSCGSCRFCLTGRPVQCATWAPRNLGDGTRPDGTSPIRHRGHPLSAHFFGQSSFSTMTVVDERAVVVVDRDLPLSSLAPLGCGIQTGAGAVLEVLRPDAGSTMAVFGAGGVGLAAVLAAGLTSLSRVIVVDVEPSRLALAAELGATDVVDASTTDPVAAIAELTAGIGVDAVLETSGVATVLRQAVDIAAVDGTVGIIGAPPAGSGVELDVTSLLLRGVHIVGINQGRAVPQVLLPALIDHWVAGRFPFDRLIRTFDFADIEAAAAAATSGEVVKPVLTMSDP